MQTLRKRAAAPQDSRAANLAAQERARQRALQRLRRLREKARAEIERLIEFLDASDLDPDLEPSLGYVAGPAIADECEADPDFELDAGDEPERDPAESGIGDLDGLLEQTANRYGRTRLSGCVEG